MERTRAAARERERVAARAHRAVASFVLIASAVAGPRAGSSEAAEPQPVPISRTSGGTRMSTGSRIQAFGISVLVPPPGKGVWAVATLVGGGERMVSARTLGDGTVIVRASRHRPTAADDATDPCADDAYLTYPHAWVDPFDWYVKIGSRPRKLARARTVAAFKRAARNLTEARNDCGLSDEIDAQQQYEGTTKIPMNVGADSSCLPPDAKSVLGFGDLGKGVIAFTCWWTENGEPVSSDVKLNKDDFGWTIEVTPSCRKRWSVEAVLTHELGHTFGLGHVSEDEHGALTMSEVIRACQASEVTLGLGDILGLQSKY